MGDESKARIASSVFAYIAAQGERLIQGDAEEKPTFQTKGNDQAGATKPDFKFAVKIPSHTFGQHAVAGFIARLIAEAGIQCVRIEENKEGAVEFDLGSEQNFNDLLSGIKELQAMILQVAKGTMME